MLWKSSTTLVEDKIAGAFYIHMDGDLRRKT